MDVGDWLLNLGLDCYAAAFRENGVSADLLARLTAEDLKQLGVTAVGHRRRLLVAIAGLRDAGRPVDDHQSPERRQITVLFCEIVGSTLLSAGLDPEELREILSAYQVRVAAAVTAEQGYIARFVGDGCLAYFGWPNADETHAESAVRAGLATIEAVGAQRLAVRIGIATGLVVTGDLIGVGAAQTMTAVGQTLNLAARLQGLAQPDTVVISDATRSQLGRLFDLEDLGPRALKGFEQPERAWRVRGKTEAASRSEAVYAGTLTPLIGRDEELAQLLRRWDEAKSGEGRIVLLSGEPGIGKSRLLAALEDRLGAEPRVSFRYFCSPHHRDSPLYPVIARLEREAGFVRGDTEAERLAKLETIMARTELSPDDVALFAALLSVPTDDRYPVLDLSPQQRKARTVAVLLRRLSDLARRQPVLMLFEDAHWSDPSTIELLDTTIKRVPHLPVLLVVSFRPEFTAPWFGHPCVSRLAPGRLNRREATMLAAQVVKDGVLSPPSLERSLLEQIVRQSDGVPLFVEELTRAVLEVPRLGSAGAALAVPGTLQASLMARLDRLPAAKTVAQIGSVIGREFSHTLLAAAARLRDTQLTEGLDELAVAGLLFRRGAPPDATYMFKHALVRDIAYSSLPKAPRQGLHLRVGEAVRDLLPERAATEPEVVAYHFAQAGLKQQAVEWWSKAGDLALRRSATVEAITHLEKALVLSRDLGDSLEQRLSRMRLLILYGNALRVARGFAAPETTSAFVQAYEIAGTLGNVPERFAALHGLWALRFQHADLAAMREVERDFLREVESEPGSPETGVAHRIGGVTRFLAGEFVNARQYLENALAHYDRDRDRPLMFRYGLDLAVPAMAYLAMTLWLLGTGEDPHGLVEQALARAEETKHKPTRAHAYAHAMGFEMLRRNPARSGPYGRDLFDFGHRHGLPAWLPYGAFGKGWAQCHAGDRAGGVAQMRDSLRPLREQGGYQTVLPLLAVLLAEAESEAGYHRAALATIDAELNRMAETGVCFLLAEAHRVRGEILLRSEAPDAGAAEAAFIRAIEAARRQSASRLEFRAASRLARLSSDQGKRGEHAGLLSILSAWPRDGSDLDGTLKAEDFADQSG